jgi:hypothetical protein
MQPRAGIALYFGNGCGRAAISLKQVLDAEGNILPNIISTLHLENILKKHTHKKVAEYLTNAYPTLMFEILSLKFSAFAADFTTKDDAPFVVNSFLHFSKTVVANIFHGQRVAYKNNIYSFHYFKEDSVVTTIPAPELTKNFFQQ